MTERDDRMGRAGCNAFSLGRDGVASELQIPSRSTEFGDGVRRSRNILIMQKGLDQVPEESFENIRQHGTSLSIVPKGRPDGRSDSRVTLETSSRSPYSDAITIASLTRSGSARRARRDR